MGWWIALGVIFLLGILPLGVSARYSGEGPLLRVVIGPVRLTLFPRKKKEKKHEKDYDAGLVRGCQEGHDRP